MEEQILQLLIEGKTQPEIASEIGKSLSYVEKCLKAIRLKYRCKTMFELGYKIKNKLKNKIMSTEKAELPNVLIVMDVLEQAHGLTHDIAYNVRIGNIDEAQKLLKDQDVLLHDAIHQQGFKD